MGGAPLHTFAKMAASVQRPVALIVLDGWGYRPDREGNAVALATTPSWDGIWSRRSRTLLAASGLRVGLPEGQMGNSEVGHLNLGAGRVVVQDLVRIDAAIADRSFLRNGTLVAACRDVRISGGTLHLMGLLGNGGVQMVSCATQNRLLLDASTERQRVSRCADDDVFRKPDGNKVQYGIRCLC